MLTCSGNKQQLPSCQLNSSYKSNFPQCFRCLAKPCEIYKMLIALPVLLDKFVSSPGHASSHSSKLCFKRGLYSAPVYHTVVIATNVFKCLTNVIKLSLNKTLSELIISFVNTSFNLT